MARHDPGILDALTRFGASLFELVQNRIELATLEIGEVGTRLVVTIGAVFAALLLFGGAVLALSAWIAAALWNSVGPAVLGWIALVYALAAVAIALWLRARLGGGPAVLDDTLAELRADAAFMRGEAAPLRRESN